MQVNHWPGNHAFTSKYPMARNLMRMKMAFPEEFPFSPLSYSAQEASESARLVHAAHALVGWRTDGGTRAGRDLVPGSQGERDAAMAGAQSWPH
jgi:hypothetical protein